MDVAEDEEYSLLRLEVSLKVVADRDCLSGVWREWRSLTRQALQSPPSSAATAESVECSITRDRKEPGLRVFDSRQLLALSVSRNEGLLQ